MSVSTATAQPTKQRDPYGVKITQTNTNQEVIQIPYVAGRVRLPAMWAGPPYNLRVTDIRQKQGSGKGSTTATVGHKYYADLIGILCLGPVSRVLTIIINNSAVWNGSAFASDYPGFVEIPLGGDNGAARIYWGTANDPAPSWFATSEPYGHPGYRWRARIELKQLLYGAQDSTQVPNVEVVCERYPTCTQFDTILPDGTHSLFIPEYGVNPFACVYEWMFHSVLGAGMGDVTDTANWKAAIVDCYNVVAFINPNINSAETFKSLITKAFEYFDGWMRMSPSGKIQVGRFQHIAATPVAFFTDNNFLSEPKISTTMLDSTLNQAIVKFVNQYNWFKDDAAVYNDFGNQLVQGFVKFVNYDRPWVGHPGLANYLASILGTLYANPTITGKITVSKEIMVGVQPGDLIQIGATTYNMAGLFRVKTKLLSEASKWTCDLEIEQERGTFTSSWQLPWNPYYTRPAVEALDISNAIIVEVPAGLGKVSTGATITILAARNDGVMLGFTPWYTKDPIGSQVYTEGNIQGRFAIPGTFLATYYVTSSVDDVYGFLLSCPNIDSDQIASQSNAVRDNFEWLIFAGKEIMSMGRVIGIGGNRFLFFTRRGCYDTPIVQHNINETAFIVQRVNMPIITNSAWKNGDTWYFKLQGFNQTNTFDLSLSSIFTYTFRGDAGGGGLNGPTNFIVGTSGNAVLFSWKNDTSPFAVGYEIRYGAVSGVWSNAKVAVTNVVSAYSVQLTNIPPNVWKFYVASMDEFGSYSAPVSYVLTIPAFTYILVEKNYGPVQHALDTGIASTPDWDTGNGAVFTNCLVHPTAYVLLPQDTQPASYIPPGGTGFELFDKFVNGWPATCTVELPVIDSLGSGYSIRNSEVVTEYLVGLSNQPVVGEDFIIALHPDWVKATIMNGVVHPTCYCVMPTTVHNASYTNIVNKIAGKCVAKSVNKAGLRVGSGLIFQGLCTPKLVSTVVLSVTHKPGFDIFDQFIYDVKPSTTITVIQDVNAAYPWNAIFDALYRPGYSNGAIGVTLSISWSSDLVTWTPLVTGINSLVANYNARYVRFQLVLDNTQPVGYVKTMNGEIVAGSSQYWTSILAQIKTSVDNVLFGNWIEVSSTFVSDEFIKPRITWNPTIGLWPVSVASLWLLLDAASNLQSDFGVAVPSGGVTIHYPIAYRSRVSVTVTSVSATSGYAEVTSYTLATFTVQVFNAGSAIAGTINWHSVGI